MYRTNAETPVTVSTVAVIFTRALRLAILFLTLIVPSYSQVEALSVELTTTKPKVGESVEITIRSNGKLDPSAVLLEPTVGRRELRLTRAGDGVFRAKYDVTARSPRGLYAVHAWTGREDQPSSIAKASFRVGNIVADFFIASSLDKRRPAADLDAYLADFRSIGGNFLVAHNVIVAAGALYPSKIVKNEVSPGTEGDVVELVLDRADRLGIPVLLSVGWDMTRQSPYKDRMAEIREIATELYELYRHHPSLVGFYSWQEGSGTYYAQFVREFSAHIKSFGRGLLTACAPHIDDPLLASYLSVIDDLDIMIYQSAVMASYRPDNRKQYPIRRVRDFSGLGAGAKRLQDKITLTHVELFAYMEKRSRPEILTASFNDIYGQILSAATVTDTDGIALFAYHTHIFDQAKRFEQGKAGRSAVEKGLKLYQTITSEISNERGPLALYIPYSDFVVERWNNYFLPALDAFRSLGIAIDILPFAPRSDESVYPYYPINMNENVLDRLLRERTILVLANVSGFQQTDSDLIKAFVERGGVVIAFGPQIPFGRTFERKALFGGDALPSKTHSRIVLNDAEKGRKGFTTTFPRTELPSWQVDKAAVVAQFEDGSAAILKNKVGKGTVFTILPDAGFSAEHFPELVRGVVNNAIEISGKPTLVPIMQAGPASDIALHESRERFSAAIVNYGISTRRISLDPKRAYSECTSQIGISKPQSSSFDRKAHRIEFSIPASEVLILRCEN